MRLLVPRVVAAVLLLCPNWSGEERLPLLKSEAVMTAQPVTLYPGQPDRTRIGALTFVGGVALRSPDPAFGGFSAMQVEGERFTLLSDGGNIVSFRMGPDWRVRDARFAAVPAGPGAGWMKRERDTEALATDPATGRAWIGFERANAIYRYAPGFSRGTGAARPRAMRRWSNNSGIESLTRLRDGSFVAISEAFFEKGKAGVMALRFLGDPVAAPERNYQFRFVPPKGYLPTDVAELPDGRLLVINRRFALPTGFAARLVVVERAAIRPGAVVRGREIARFESPALHDNFEALAVTQEAGRPILWIASDDNQAFFQQSLLLKFAL